MKLTRDQILVGAAISTTAIASILIINRLKQVNDNMMQYATSLDNFMNQFDDMIDDIEYCTEMLDENNSEIRNGINAITENVTGLINHHIVTVNDYSAHSDKYDLDQPNECPIEITENQSVEPEMESVVEPISEREE